MTIINNLSLIVAIDQQKGIGYQNKLLFHLSKDLKRFKAITSGHTIVMGKNTLYSLPKWPLPDRRHIVLTTNSDTKFPGCESAHSVEEVLEKTKTEKEVFIIGGASVYKQFYPIVKTIYLTKVEKEFPADTFFDCFEPSDWSENDLEEYFDEKNDFHYQFSTLKR